MKAIVGCCDGMCEALAEEVVAFDDRYGPHIRHEGKCISNISYCPWCGRIIKWKEEEE